MAGRGRLVCAGLLLMLLSGCIRAYVADWIEAGLWERAMPGEPASVAALVQAHLGRLGLFASSSREGNTVVVQSKTRSGKQFSLLFSESPTARGKVTIMRIRWEGESDQDFWLDFLGVLDNKQARAPAVEEHTQPAGKQ